MNRSAISLSCAILVGCSTSLTAIARELPISNLPPALAAVHDIGPVAADQRVTLSLVLNLHNESELDTRIAALYDRSSPTFRQWLTAADLVRYMPTAAEYAAVRSQLVDSGFEIVTDDDTHLSLRVSAPASVVEGFFHTQLDNVNSARGAGIAHVGNATLGGAAGLLVGGVVGLDRHAVHPQLVVARNQQTNKPLYSKPYAQALAAGAASQFTTIALGPKQVATSTSPDGTQTISVSGQIYDPSGLSVTFTPAQLRTYYGLNELSQLGYDGTGQTVVLVEGYGYASTLSDVNAFSKMFGLPAMDATSLKVVYPEGKPVSANIADLTGWTTEIALDVQTVHSLAPGAKILIVASDGQDDEDQIASLSYIISHKLPKVVSCSWENDTDASSGSAERAAFDSVLKIGAASGYAFQFSTGDNSDDGLYTPSGAPGVPSESPYATAVGGTAILNDDQSGSSFTPVGWGDEITYLSDSAGDPLYPASSFIYSGAGGGISLTEPKPAWQKSLPGKTRMVPDIAALADPYTGVAVVVTEDGSQSLEAGVGGTSLAAPLISATWAIAQQYGHRTLGQIAPILSQLAPGEITDVVPTPAKQTARNVSGSLVVQNKPTVTFNTNDIYSTVLYGQKGLVTALAPTLGVSPEIPVLGFGLDNSLTTKVGWDYSTGWGEPNGLPFIVAVTH